MTERNGVVIDEWFDPETKASVIRCTVRDQFRNVIRKLVFPRSVTPEEISQELNKQAINLVHSGGEELGVEPILHKSDVLFKASREVEHS